MNKQEKLIVGILAGLLVAILFWQNRQSRRLAETQSPVQPADTEAVAPSPALPADTEISAGTGTPESDSQEVQTSESPEFRDPENSPKDEEPKDEEGTLPETTAAITNGAVRLTLTSKGGAIQEAKLLRYRRTEESPEDDIVTLDFSAIPALSIEGVPGFGLKSDYAIEVSEDDASATLTARNAAGLTLVRTIAFAGDEETGSVPTYEKPLRAIERLVSKDHGYRLTVTDTFRNGGAEEVPLPARRVNLGSMAMDEGRDGNQYIGVDVRENTKDGVSYGDFTARDFYKLFGGSAGGGCSGGGGIPATADRATTEDVAGRYEWVAVRTRFFTQVLTPAQSFGSLRLRAVRTEATGTQPASLATVGAAAGFDAETLAPNDSVTATYDFYVGPRKMANLRRLGMGQVRVTHLGFWRFFCELLLDILNLFYAIIPNYGVAIILLTALTRLLMYPLTKRQNESMKRMSAMQPKLKEIQERYKDDPQKIQRETMRLYQEYKVNPLSSCGPMLLQLPIFVAFFTMLRCAVELRFAPFLWIGDLSMPENLFREQLGFGLNILPIAMCAAMYFQSKLMPSGGDPKQQQMMAVMMPVMMLFFFYPSASGLCLYWGTSTLFSIYGTLRNRNRMKKAEAAAGGDEIIVPPRETRQMRRAKDRV